MGTPHSLSRTILQRAARAEVEKPLRVIAVEGAFHPGDKLEDVAPRLRVVEARDHDDLRGVNVVTIVPGQETHRLYEAAEVRRRSRIQG
jgi:hypothetical protein